MADFSVITYHQNKVVREDTIQSDVNGKVQLQYLERELIPSMEPYQIVARPVDSAGYQIQRLYVITPVIQNAIFELQTLTDRINSKTRLSDLQLTDADYMDCLKTGRDQYNAAGTVPTTFTMLAAADAIYGYWLLYSQAVVLRTRYLDEGMSSFQYQGAAIELQTEYTGYLESLLGNIQQQIETGIREHKMFLGSKGISGGDGGVIGRRRVPGATGVSAGPLNSRGYNLSTGRLRSHSY